MLCVCVCIVWTMAGGSMKLTSLKIRAPLCEKPDIISFISGGVAWQRHGQAVAAAASSMSLQPSGMVKAWHLSIMHTDQDIQVVALQA